MAPDIKRGRNAVPVTYAAEEFGACGIELPAPVLRGRVLAAALAALALLASAPAVAQTHLGATSPLIEGWTVTAGDTGTSGSPIASDSQFPGVAAWQIDELGSTRLRYEVSGPASTLSWTLRSRMRVIDLNDAVDAGILLEVANGVNRFLLLFGSNASGGTRITLSGTATTVTIPALQAPATHTEYVVVELAYNDAEGSADLFVNGLAVASDYAGFAGALSRVNFGDGSGTDVGQSRYAALSFSTGPQACRDGIDNDADGLTDFSGGDSDCSAANDPTEARPVAPCLDAVDFDGDGLCDVDEGVLGANPNDADSDDDGLKDGVEVVAGSGLLEPDSDDDGLKDGDELGTGRFGKQRLISSLADGALSVFAADLDGDGDTDTLSASSIDHKVAWYENLDGAGSFGLLQVISTLGSGAAYALAADLDGDNDLDVLAASVSDDEIAWYENTDGAGSFGPQQLISTLANNPFSLYAADLDRDGDTDVLSASSGDDEIAWYENSDGAGTFAAQQLVSTLADGARSVFAADMDGDGDTDVFSASEGDNGIAWYENTDGTGSFSPQQVISTLASAARAVAAADVDGDRDTDVLSASASDDEIAWYENTDGTGSFSPQQVISTLADSARSVVAVDLDADGDTDALSASANDDEVAWYENTDGTGSFSPQQVISTLADGATAVVAADVDGDGDLDVLSASNSDDEIAWYEQTGTGPLDPDTDDDGLCDGGPPGTSPACALGGEDANGNGSYDVGLETDPANPDTDGDGLQDGFEGAAGTGPLDPDSDDDGLRDGAELGAATDPLDADSDDDGLLDGAELGSGAFAPQQVISTLADAAGSVFAVDLDGDDDIDVLSASGNDDEIAWYENTDGAGSFGPQQEISTLADGAGSVFAVDLDGDDDIDVLSASFNDDEIAWYENTDGAGSFGPQQGISTLADGAVSVHASDLDGDGDADVLSASAIDGKLAWYENTDGAGSFGPQHLFDLTLAIASVHTADVNGDGRTDALSAAPTGSRIAWYQNVGGTPLFGPAQVISTLAEGASSVYAADIDADGDADVLSTSHDDDKLAWYENTNGAGAFGPQQVISTLANTPSSVVAADVDGDGDTDVLSASQADSEIAWYENLDGAGSFGPQRVISTLADSAQSVFAADLDGDGDTDVLSASFLDDKIAWYEQTGADPLDPDSDDDGLCDGGPPGSSPACAAGGEDTNGNGRYDVGLETDPNDADTDGDAFSDGAEVAAGTDPLDEQDFPGTAIPTLPRQGYGLLLLLFASASAWLEARPHVRPSRGSRPRT